MLCAMEKAKDWLGCGKRESEAEDTVSSMPILPRRSHGYQSEDAESCQDSVASSAGFWGPSNVLRKLRAPSPLLRLTDPDKGESNALRQRSELWTPDRGPGFYETQRARYAAPHLLTTGKHAGRSRIQFSGIDNGVMTYHVWKRDFFTSIINLSLTKATLLLVCLYTAAFFFWATVWWVLWRAKPHCVKNFKNYASAFVFSVATQQTIGYGDLSPDNCWWSAYVMVTQSLFALLLNAVVLGIVFARISRPAQRGRTIFLTDSAVIARRDGTLKFMFRVADIRPVFQVVNPKLSAHLYTWGQGRITAEGDTIPVLVEDLELCYNNGVMLLPIMVQHTIDERSPLWGHSHDSLQAAGAEIVVVFEGVSEFGNLFSTRQSYLPREIFWGYQFVQIIHCAEVGTSRHIVDIARFHELEPQSTVMELVRPSQLSRKVLVPPRGIIPASDLATNTLVVSDHLSMASGPSGQARLAVRIGDTRSNQLREVHVRMWLYRWHSALISSASSQEPFEMHELRLKGSDRLCLRLPVIVSHDIADDSPLAAWVQPAGSFSDADSEIVVMVEAVTYAGQRLATRQRTYSTLSDIKSGHNFAPMVTRPGETVDGHPGIQWNLFHKMVADDSSALTRAPSLAVRRSSSGSVSFGTPLQQSSLGRIGATTPRMSSSPSFHSKVVTNGGEEGIPPLPTDYSEAAAVFGSPFSTAMGSATVTPDDNVDSSGRSDVQPALTSSAASERSRLYASASGRESGSRTKSPRGIREVTRGGRPQDRADTSRRHSNSSRSSRSPRGRVNVQGSTEATSTSNTSAATLSDDGDTWKNTRSLRNVVFPPLHQQPPA